MRLYNGNISNSTLAISQIKSGAPVGYSYHYDQLNLLKATRQHKGITGSTWDRTSIKEAYAENVTYDGNGNILAYNRHGADSASTPNMFKEMDSLRYNYNRDGYGKLTDNKLRQVNDKVSATNYTADIDDQSDANNYTYDAIGNLVHDTQAGIDTINWTVYGKIKNIVKGANTIAYTYSPAGQRVSKTAAGLTTYYVRDAQGNTMALYDDASSHSNWREQHLYGSSRLGMWRPNVNLASNNAATVFDTTGIKFFELNNHLSNVLATITDRRVQIAAGSVVGRYDADVANAQDYFPFGSLQPGRQFTANSTTYRYDFNGKENDNEVDGDDWQDYGARMYSKKLGRFGSEDPISGQYPELTPFQFGSNNPVANIDLDGLEGKNATTKKGFLNPPVPLTPPIILPPIMPGGALIEEQAVKQGAKIILAIPVVLLTAIIVAIPVPTDGHAEANREKEINRKGYMMYNAIKNHHEFITNNPAELSDEYLKQVRDRLATGKAYSTDYQYADEAYKRIGRQNILDIKKAVNSDISHAIKQSLLRNIFKNIEEAIAGLKALTKLINDKGFPEGSIVDPSKTDRVLVPIGDNGLAAYQVGKNGTAKLKTVLIKK